MNRDETARLLRTRSALTSQPYGDDAIEAWQEVLGDRNFVECRTALVDASKATKKITVADVIALLPVKDWGGPVAPPETCVLCDGCGWVSVPADVAHDPRFCRPTETQPCACHAAEPCRCTTGRGMVEVHRRIRQFSDNNRPPWARDAPPPDPRRLDLSQTELGL